MPVNLDQCSAFQTLAQLQQTVPDLKTCLTPERITQFQVNQGLLNFVYATARVDAPVLDALQALCDEQECIGMYRQLLSGAVMNTGENRKVLHHQLRSKTDRGFYGVEQQRFSAFAAEVHTKKWRGFTGKPFDTVVQVGIGGSDLGPRAVYYALERAVITDKGKLPMTAHFIANVDPDDANLVMSRINVETTLFVVVSKSGTTQETLTNERFVKEKAKAAGLPEAAFKQHFIAVTGKGSPMDNPAHYLASFYIDDNIGGRYSVTSAVGGVVLSLAFGPDVFEAFLQGASDMDEAALDPDIRTNMTLLSAVIGVWERQFLGYSSKAVIPYAEALHRFPAHLQQLDCESNGKRVNRQFEPISYQTGPVIFGEPGTNGQHSFFQKLHQGSDVIPIQFIGFKQSQMLLDFDFDCGTSQTKLIANMVAQMIALAVGKTDVNPNKVFPGNRPTTLVWADRLTPEVMGALLAFYENVVMFQGFLWHINSFDQEGVQLGKVLTGQLLDTSKAPDPLLATMMRVLS